MPDYSKYNVPSPDMWHSPIVECQACLSVIIEGEEFTVAELLKAIDSHDDGCIPKTWEYSVGHIVKNAFDESVIYEIWGKVVFLTDAEKSEMENHVKSFRPDTLVKFEPRAL